MCALYDLCTEETAGGYKIGMKSSKVVDSREHSSRTRRPTSSEDLMTHTLLLSYPFSVSDHIKISEEIMNVVPFEVQNFLLSKQLQLPQALPHSRVHPPLPPQRVHQ